MNAVIVAGTRPNFVKLVPLIRAIDAHNIGHGTRRIEYTLIHTGQHYDIQLSGVFFQDKLLPQPDIFLGVGSGTHAEQTGKAMIEMERVLLEKKPDLVVVIGDVNSTLAASLVAVKLHIPIAHIEAGLRVYNFVHPEEVNRLLTDTISTYLFTPSRSASNNLIKEGIPESRIFFVGNILADSIYSQIGIASQRPILSNLGLNKSRKSLKQFGLESGLSLIDINQKQSINKPGLYIIEPLGYLDFLQMESNAKIVITDSGGLQAETTILNIPCITLMEEDLWPITSSQGTNILVGTDPEKMVKESFKILDGTHQDVIQPEFWDGKTAERIVAVIDKYSI
jgi:UDP-N-acetylglucosamine 2-epimerase (non-hydrolysing)